MPWEQTQIKLPVPDELSELLGNLENFAANAESVLGSLNSALEVARSLYIANLDLFSALVGTILDKLEEFVNDFFGTGASLLIVDPFQVGDTFKAEKLRTSIVVPQDLATDSQGNPVENAFVKFSPLTDEQRTINETEKKWFGEQGVKGVYRVAHVSTPEFDNFGMKLLTPVQCAEAMADSFLDRGDDARPQFSNDASVAAFGFIITAPTLDGFIPILQSLVELFDLDELRQLVEKVTKIQLNRDKVKEGRLPSAQPPNWKSARVNSIAAMAKLQKNLIKQLNLLRGFSVSDADVITDLIDVIQSKVQSLAAVADDLQDIIGLLNQNLDDSGIYAINYPLATGGVSRLRRELLAESPLDEIENKFSLGLLFVGGVPGDEPSALITEPVEKLRSLIFS